MNIHPFDKYNFEEDSSDNDITASSPPPLIKNKEQSLVQKPNKNNIQFIPTVMGKKVKDTISSTEPDTDSEIDSNDEAALLEAKKKELKKKREAKKKANKANKGTGKTNKNTKSNGKTGKGKGKGKTSLKNKNTQETITADLKSQIKGTSKELLDLIFQL